MKTDLIVLLVIFTISPSAAGVFAVAVGCFLLFGVIREKLGI